MKNFFKKLFKKSNLSNPVWQELPYGHLTTDSIKPDFPFDKNKMTWNEYWREAYVHKYIANHMMNAAQHPKLFQEFLYQFSEFNWKKVKKFMKNTGWVWGSGSGVYFPDEKDLQANIIELFSGCISSISLGDKYSKWGSGGFTVSANKETNEVKIEFSYK